MDRLKRVVKIHILILCFILLGSQCLFAAPQLSFNGNGTETSPYLIENYEDLCEFRDLVNQGNDFKNKHFLQTVNIDLKDKNWTPIGIFDSDKYFYGVYDGGGHHLQNLQIGVNDTDKENSKDKKKDKKEEDNGKEDNTENKTMNNGLFGSLGGTVINLGIESGEINGNFCGSIASSSVGEKAAIINCYNKATVKGTFAGGIVYSFNKNPIVTSWNSGDLQGEVTGGIVASGGDVKLYHCYTTSPVLAQDDIQQENSRVLPDKELFSQNFAKKLSINASFAQYLFAAPRDTNIMEWQVDENNQLTFSDNTGYIDFLGFINIYFLPILVLLILILYSIRFYQAGKNRIYQIYSKDIKAIAIIFGILSLFLNTAFINKGIEYLNFGNSAFIILVNAIFLVSLAFVIKNRKWRFVWKREFLPITILIFIVVALELLQFDIVPRYDGQLYYGSFIKSIELFQLDFLTYLGAFFCWKWAHGLSLLIAPFEFLMTGEVIGVYIANVIITIVSLICFYWILRRLFIKISPILATLSCAVLIFSPYGLGVFNYLCMDWHIPFFLIWLIAAYMKKNDVMISFCGFLLAFTKITGLAFYVLFLIVITILELRQSKDNSFIHNIKQWWNWKRIILWILPGILFVGSYIWEYQFAIQSFYSSDTAATVSLKCKRGIANTLLQSYIYGFRWLLLILLAVMVFLLIKKRRNIYNILEKTGVNILIAMVAGCLASLFMYLMYNGIAECPRYTAMYNLFYAFSLPIALAVIFKKEVMKRIAAGAIVGLLLIQTYITIDPSIILTSDSLDTGKKNIYKVAMPNDIRPAMSLGTTFWSKNEVIGDIYVYNLEYTFYDDLAEQLLKEINPTKEDVFYSLDLLSYESHIFGNHYKIYWNERTQRRTFNGLDKDSVYPKEQRDILTEDLYNIPPNELNLADSFYLIVAARTDEERAVEQLKKLGYKIIHKYTPENIYGKMSVYKFEKE